MNNIINEANKMPFIWLDMLKEKTNKHVNKNDAPIAIPPIKGMPWGTRTLCLKDNFLRQNKMAIPNKKPIKIVNEYLKCILANQSYCKYSVNTISKAHRHIVLTEIILIVLLYHYIIKFTN